MTSVVLPTLAIVGSWLLFALALLGIGYLTRLVLFRAFARGHQLWKAEHPKTADLWLGLAAVILYLLLWNDVAPVDWTAWSAPAAVAVAGLIVGAPRLRMLRGCGLPVPTHGRC